MADFIEVIKTDSKVQDEISQTIEIYNKELLSTHSKIGQNAFIQSKVFEQAMNFTGDIFDDMHIEIEQKDNKKEILENKIGLPDSEGIEEMKRLGLIEALSDKKVIESQIQ